MRKQINLIKTVLIVLVSCFGLASINGCGGSGDNTANVWQITSESPVIKEITVSAPLKTVGNGDFWLSTWADDDSLFFTWGDGYGPNYPDVRQFSHFGLVKTNDSLPNISLQMVKLGMAYGEVMDSKPGSLLFYNGRLYTTIHAPMLTPYYSGIIYSDDYGNSFKNEDAAAFLSSPWQGYNSNFLCKMFINMGKGYSLNTDGYVYVFGMTAESFGNGSVYLARVPKDRIMEYSVWEYFVALDSGGNPTWSPNQSAARPLSNLESTWVFSSMYHPGIGRYIILTGNQTYGKFYDAPNPWGPWTLVNYWYSPVLNSELYTNTYMPALITKDAGSNYFYFTTAGVEKARIPSFNTQKTLKLVRIDMILK